MPPHDDLVRQFGSPLYVYDAAEIRRRARLARSLVPLDGVDILYAMKANANPAILGILRDEGLGVDAVSLGEVLCALKAGFPPGRISYNGNNVSGEEMKAVVERGVHVTVDGISQLDTYGRLFPGTTVGLRVNPEIGDGHHDHVITGGPESKFGIEPKDLDHALAVATGWRLRIDVLHQHIGSGILDTDSLLAAIDVMLGLAPRFPDLDVVDFGGGLGVPYRPGETEIDVVNFGKDARRRLLGARDRAKPSLIFRFEPGRFLVATSGTLLVTVTAVKRGARHTFVGTDSGFNHLLRPILYDAWHPIENLSNPDGPVERVTIAGNICESGDLFAKDRPLPKCREGDILAIRNAGAYGYSMSSNYNLRPRPAEILLDADGRRLIRARETIEGLLDR